MSTPFSASVTPTVGTAPYIAGDSVGDILKFPLGFLLNGGYANLDSLVITDKSKTHPALFVEFFKSSPSGGTYTDSSPLVYGSGDHAKKLKLCSILATDWVDLPRVSATTSTVDIGDLNKSFATSDPNVYMLIHADAGFSLTAGDLIVTISGTTG